MDVSSVNINTKLFTFPSTERYHTLHSLNLMFSRFRYFRYFRYLTRYLHVFAAVVQTPTWTPQGGNPKQNSFHSLVSAFPICEVRNFYSLPLRITFCFPQSCELRENLKFWYSSNCLVLFPLLPSPRYLDKSSCKKGK